jgi:DNA-binding transcriptional LysR family regulator
LASIEEAEQEITSQSSKPIGRLRVSAPVAFGASHVAPQVAAFIADHPKVSVELILNDRMIDLVDEGYDIAIRIGRLADSSLVARKINEMRLICCAAPGYLKAHSQPKTPQDLVQHECILYSYASSGAMWTFLNNAEETSVKVKGRVACNNGEAISQMAIRGLGVALQPDFIAAPHIKAGRLQQLLPDYAPEAVGIYAIHQSRRHTPVRIRSFIDHLAAAFSQGSI